jgi:methylglutaconyl-CoA hydratase
MTTAIEQESGNVLTIVPSGPVLRLQLARPARRNALSRTLVAALLEAFTSVKAGGKARAIVLAGEGPVFCAGGDISEYAESATSGRAGADAETLAELLAAMVACPVPIVARVQGAAYGGGFGLVCAADVAIASAETTFSLSEARLGLIPAVISPYVFAALGAREAKARMLLASPFGIDDALRTGLIQRVVPADQLDTAVAQTVADLLRCAPGALAAIKRLPALFAGVDASEIRAATARLLTERLASDEAREGLHAFLEKRPPAWAKPG